jgi:hypothetical protein
LYIAELKRGMERKIYCVVLGNSETQHPTSQKLPFTVATPGLPRGELK